MKKIYPLTLILLAPLFSEPVMAQNGCITCALSEILKEEWRNPNYGSAGGGTFGWTFNLRDRFGRRVLESEFEELEKKLNDKNVQKVDKQAVIYGNDGLLQYKLVPHLITLKSGEPYYVYQRYIVGFH